MRRSTTLILFALIFWQPLLGQYEPIVLTNPSFEGVPADGTLFGVLPAGWYDCGFSGETVPDVHPQIGGGAFRVKKPPYQGNTYLGMVVRENDTWEMVTQRLITPLEGGKCFEFSIYLCKSELYVSPSRVDERKVVNYTKPAKLRIWGGSEYCHRDELLAESNMINNSNWQKYKFRFEPQHTHTHLVFEAFYKTPTLIPYNGNILLDNCSSIVPVPCDAEVQPPIVEVAPRPPQRSGGETQKPRVITKPAKQPQKHKILKALDRRTLRKGLVIRIDQLFFLADSPELVDTSYVVLNEVHDFLNENPDVVIEIGGHTNSNPEDDYCDRLSKARAKAVVDFLVGKGIPEEQLVYKGYGKRRPIAPNNTEEGRKKNQRVEIKVLSFND